MSAQIEKVLNFRCSPPGNYSFAPIQNDCAAIKVYENTGRTTSLSGNRTIHVRVRSLKLTSSDLLVFTLFAVVEVAYYPTTTTVQTDNDTNGRHCFRRTNRIMFLCRATLTRTHPSQFGTRRFCRGHRRFVVKASRSISKTPCFSIGRWKNARGTCVPNKKKTLP